MTALLIPLRGAGGEPVDFWRTAISHGLVFLPPTMVDEEHHVLHATVRTSSSVLTVSLREHDGNVAVSVPDHVATDVVELERIVRHVLRLDEDLSGFYEAASNDPELHWAGIGAARLIRSQSVFEEVIKTICTTNCSWSATERMIKSLVGCLGDPEEGDTRTSARRAFPTPAAMAAAPAEVYRDEMRCGYRAPFLQEIARRVESGETDLEGLGRATPSSVTDEEVEIALRTLPGVGTYAAAHIMLLMGRYSRLVLDSWTRPKYAQLVGRQKSDRQIAWRFRNFGPYAGLAFWLFVTQDWAEEPAGIR